MMLIFRTSAVLVNFLSALSLCYALINCPDENLYVQRNNYLRCKKIVNCRPDHEILDCEKNCEPLKCEPCKSGYIQPDLIHWDSKYQSCFKRHADYPCIDENLKPKAQSRTGEDDTYCSKAISCKCSKENCFYGHDPCLCHRQFKECDKNETLNSETGICEPCPPGHYKLSAGCGECFRNPILDSTTQSPYMTKLNTKSTPDDNVQVFSTLGFRNTNATTVSDRFLVDDETMPTGDSRQKVIAKSTLNSGGKETNSLYIVGGILIIAVVVILIAVAFVLNRNKNKNQRNRNTDAEGLVLGNANLHYQGRQPEELPLRQQNGHLTHNTTNGILKDRLNNEARRNINGALDVENRLLNELNDDNVDIDQGNSSRAYDGHSCNNRIDDVKTQQTILGESLAVKQSLQYFQRENTSFESSSDPTDHPAVNNVVNTSTDQRNANPEAIVLGTVQSRNCSDKPSTSRAGQPISPESESPGIHPLTVSSHDDRYRKLSSLQMRNIHGLRLSTQESMTDKNKPVTYPTEDSINAETEECSLSNSFNPNQKEDMTRTSEKTENGPSDCVTLRERVLKPQVEHEEDTERKPIFTRSFEDSGFDTNR